MTNGERRRWLLRRWVELCDRLAPDMPFEAADAMFAILQGMYSYPRRHYHGFAHVAHGLRTLDDLFAAGAECDRPDLVRLAMWTHDAVFEAQRNDNESRSAEVTRLLCGRLGLSAADTQTAADLVLATRHRAGVPLTPDERLLCDADLAILAGEPEAYDAYAAGIRREFAFLDDTEFASGRAGFIQRMLGRERIFQTEVGSRLFEDQARDNLKRELACCLMGA